MMAGRRLQSLVLVASLLPCLLPAQSVRINAIRTASSVRYRRESTNGISVGVRRFYPVQMAGLLTQSVWSLPEGSSRIPGADRTVRYTNDGMNARVFRTMAWIQEE